MSARYLLLVLAACAGTDPSPLVSLDAQVAPDAAADVGVDAGPPPDAGFVDAGPPRRVLFIGNSYTFQHDVPALVQALGAVTPGGAIVPEMIAQGGAFFYTHAANKNTMARIATGGFDFVVLQGQSQEPFRDPEGFNYGAGILGEAVQEAGAQGVWFATWARREGHPDYGGYIRDPAWMTWSLEQGYLRVAAPFEDPVALVGAAFQLARATHPDVVLYDADGSHASPTGAFLASCVLFRAITGLEPQVPDPAPFGLDATLARALCALAGRTRPTQEPCYDTFCGDECANLERNPRHCGGCNIACNPGDPCRDGVCGCPEPYSGCGEICYDLNTSVYHCGRCDIRCGEGEFCDQGTCECSVAAVARLPNGPADLTALISGCDAVWSGDQSWAKLDCLAAAHQYCAGYAGCFDSGLPPATGHAPTHDDPLCVQGTLHTTDLATLQTFEPTCTEYSEFTNAPCITAISRYCAANGAVSGFGPVAQSGDQLTVTCLPEATPVRVLAATLQNQVSRCQVDPVTCQAAARSYCENLGHAGGFGPVELAGEEAEVICIGTRPQP